MKKVILTTLLLFIATSTNVFSQKIKKHEIDKFSKAEIIETSSENLFRTNYMASGYQYMFDFIIRRTNGVYTMPASILTRNIEKYTEDSGVIFLLSNGDKVVLQTSYIGISGKKYANGYFFNTSFTLSNDDVQKLKNNAVTDIRITYMGGHYDKEIKDSNQMIISKCLKLFDNIK